jgi:hypothetical protein
MPTQDPKLAADSHRTRKTFGGSHLGYVARWLTHSAKTGQPFDATFFDREPILEVSLDSDFASKFLAVVRSALARPSDVRELAELCREGVKFSDGNVAPLASIWMLNPMPPGGIDNEALSRADIARAEERAGQNGETIREMIRDTYRCDSAAEEDYFVRRWICS